MNNDVMCDLCPRECRIKPGGTGFCGARGVPGFCGARGVPGIGDTGLLHCARNDSNTVVSLNYGKLTSVALDPIEKKPLRRFHPGSMILSVGSFGCNLDCPWCQNHYIARAREEGGKLWEISQTGHKEPSRLSPQEMSPEALAGLAEEYVPMGNIGVAFTYNEPLISYEYVRDTSGILKERGLKSVMVTNGYASPPYFESLLDLVDAMNIDLKSIRNEFYNNIGGDADTVKQNIKSAFGRCHIEITCLLIEGLNDREDEMEEMADYISSVSPDIPFHISRFFPRYKFAGQGAGQREPSPLSSSPLSLPTRIHRMEKFKEIADKKLNHVFLGNI